MKVKDTYDLYLTLDGKEINLGSQQISFVLDYSIWNILPSAIAIIQDQSSLLHESLLTVPGTSFNIQLGLEDIYIQGDFIIDYDENISVDSPSRLGGDLKIPLLHKWVQNQERLSTSWNKRISEIIEEKANSEYSFSDVIINDTSNQDYWYQLLYTDIEFIENILLPKAYSANSNNTPFFCFINEYNEFHFRNYKSMWDSNTTITLIYYPTDEKHFSLNNITDVRRKRMSYTELLDYEKVSSYIIDSDTGELSKQNSILNQYSNLNSSDNIPYRGNGTITNYRFYDKNSDFKEIFGELIFDQRNSLKIDQFYIIIPFNPAITIGTSINLKFFFSSGSDSYDATLSQYSGKYLVSRSTIIWDSQNAVVLHRIGLIRKGTTYTNDYILKAKLT